MTAKTNPRVDPVALLQSHVIKELDELILMVSESSSQHDGVDSVYSRIEQLIFNLMRANFMNFIYQGVLELVLDQLFGESQKYYK